MRPDGCDHEASIPYHRLVTELFVCGTQAVDALAPGPAAGAVPRAARPDARLRRATTRGRTGWPRRSATPTTAASSRSATTGARTTARTCTCFARRVARTSRPRVTLPIPTAASTSCAPATSTSSCAAATPASAGSAGTPTTTSSRSSCAPAPRRWWSDPGAYLYTADPPARNLFRSTAYHATLRIGGRRAERAARGLPVHAPGPDPRRDARVGAASRRGGVRGPAPRLLGARASRGAPAPARAPRRRAHAGNPRRRDLRGRPRPPLDVALGAGRAGGGGRRGRAGGGSRRRLGAGGRRASAQSPGAQASTSASASTSPARVSTSPSRTAGTRPASASGSPAPFLRARRRSRPGEDVQELLLRVS